MSDPERYGVVEFDGEGRPAAVVEKPSRPRSNWAVTGLYFYDSEVAEVAAGLRPSGRGELEITDLNARYLEQGRLRVEKLGRGFAWLDTGTHESLKQATDFVKAIQDRQGLKISCVEEIAYRLGLITRKQLEDLARDMLKNEYGQYLMEVLEEDDADTLGNHDTY